MEKEFYTEAFPVRKGTNCVKWDNMASRYDRDDLMPLWVADMDFPSPPSVRKALADAVSHGVFGYFAPPASYQEAFIRWETEHHGVTPKKEWLRFTPGVITGIYWAIHSLTAPADGIAILTPCYYPFMDAVRDTGRKLVCSELVRVNGRYTMDLKDLEQKIESEHVTMLLLCTPHNPVGRVWEAEELTALLELCARHGVLVISDEIHQDIVFGGHKNHSCLGFEAHLGNMIVLTSGSKTFNIAGLQNSFAIIPNAEMRSRFDAYVKTVRIKKGVSLGYIAAEAGFRDGGQWLEEMLEYLQGNYDALKRTLTDALPEIHIDPLEGTYMIWVDIGAYVKHADIQKVVLDGAHLAVDFGSWFWPEELVPQDDGHIRINIATSRENVVQAAKQLIDAIRAQ